MTDSRLRPPRDLGGDDLEGTAAAYALGALPAEEARAFERQLAARPDLRARLTEWATVVDALYDSTAEVEPPPRLRSRLLDAALTDQAPSTTAPLARGVSAAPVSLAEARRQRDGQTPTAQTRSVRRPLDTRFYAPLAALLVLSLGLAWSLWQARADSGAVLQQLADARSQLGDAQSQLGQARGQLAQIQTQLGQVSDRSSRYTQVIRAIAAGNAYQLKGTPAAPQLSGYVVLPEGGQPVLIAQGLPQLGPNQVYQAWTIAGGTAQPAGVFGTEVAQGELIPIQRSLSGAGAVAITVEPGPNGSTTPTLPIVAAADLNQS